MKKAHRYLIFIIVIALVIGGVVGLSIFKNKDLNKPVVSVNAGASSNTNANYKPVLVTKDNLVGYLQNQQLIKDIPDDGTIVLKLYNFNSGAREIENSYVLTKGKVVEGDASGDVIIYLDSKYVSQLGNLCAAMKSAKQNGELGFDSTMNQVSFSWKYKGLMKYKDCFGL